MIVFDSLRHLEGVVAALGEAARAGRLAHAYLFWGPEGVGKTRTAQALAQQILCSAPDAPCGLCVGCDQVARLVHPDLHPVLPSLKTTEDDERRQLEAYASDPFHILQIPRNATIGIERIRGVKIESSKARVAQGNRVVILRDADRMTDEAAQAALKLIEEPQPDTYLILTARDPHRLLPTILSRCQRIRFPGLPRSFLEKVLLEHGVEDSEVRLIAGLAGGGLGRALSLVSLGALAARDRALEIFCTPVTQAQEVARRAQGVAGEWDAGAAQVSAELLLSWYGDIVAVQSGMTEEALVHADRVAELRSAASRLSLGRIRCHIAALEDMLQAIEQNVNPLLALQAALLQINGLVEADPLF